MARYRKKSSGNEVQPIIGLLILFTVCIGIIRTYLDAILQTIAIVLFICTLVGILYFLYRMLQISKDPELQPVARKSNRVTASQFQPCFAELNGTLNPTDGLSICSTVPQVPRIEELTILEPLEWDETVLVAIEWKRFEVVCKEYFRMNGFNPQETNIGADGGVDIRLYKADEEPLDKPHAIVQCKAWNTYKVGVKLVRELFGIMAAEQVGKGVLITSGEFSSQAQDFAKGKKIQLISGQQFVESIRKLSPEQQYFLLDIALEGDYTTPTCPKCDTKMRLCEAKSGNNKGSKFWGCVSFPRCHQTFKYKNESAVKREGGRLLS